MLETSKPRLAIYAALAIAVLLIGARYLRSSGGDGGAGSGGDVAAVSTDGAGASSLGAPDGASGGVGADGTMSDDGGTDGSGAADAAAGADGAGADGSAGTGAAGAGADSVVVDVKGAVRRPGVYRLAPGARALDAVHRAGGMTGKADRIGVNLAARVSDGGEVIVPAKGHGGGAAIGVTSGASGASDSAAASDGSSEGTATTPLSIDLNTASEQDLEQLDGVGPATAQKIIDYREQHGGIGSVDELDAVSGIGERKLAAIEAQLGQ